MQVWLAKKKRMPRAKKPISIMHSVKEGDKHVKDIVHVIYELKPPGPDNKQVASKLANKVPRTSVNSNEKVFGKGTT